MDIESKKKETKKIFLKQLILSCNEQKKKESQFSSLEKMWRNLTVSLDVNRLPFAYEWIEEVLIELFEKEEITLKEMESIGIPSNMIDKVCAKRWFPGIMKDGTPELDYIASIQDRILKARVIVGRIYGEKKDLSGNPQSWHLSAVSEAMSTYEGKVVGYLHDVVEDGYLTLMSLIHIFKFSGREVRAIDVLTRDKEIHPTYTSYIENQILPTRSVLVLEEKEADMENNQSPGRTELLEEKAREKALTKYKQPLVLVRKRKQELLLERRKRK